MYELRTYQKESSDEAINFVRDKADKRKSIIVAPTGAGKSLIIAAAVNQIDSPVVVLQPSKELLMQNYEKYTSYGNEAKIFSASLNSKEIGHVTFATIGSIISSAAELKRKGVRTLFIDECHLACSPGGQIGRFINTLDKCKVVGLTASPVILKNDALMGPMLKMLNRTRDSMFNHFLHITQVKEVVQKGYWSKLIYEEKKIDESKLQYNSSRSEFTEESQREVYEDNNIEQKIINKVAEIRGERPSILIFVSSVLDAIQLASRIPGARAIWGNMSKGDRDEIVEGFLKGSIPVVVNVIILSVGFDFPGLSCVIDAAPTASFGRYYQKVGRACRINPGKEDALIVDLAGNFGRFGKLSGLTFENHPAFGWAMFSGNKLLTGVPVAGKPVYKPESRSTLRLPFGRYKNTLLTEVSENYLRWLMKEFKWSPHNLYIKDEVRKILKERV